MAVPLTPTSPTDRILKQLEREQKEEADGKAAAWAFLWILFWFKIVTVGIIWYVAAGSGESLVLIASTTWYWLVIPVMAISGPLIVRWRMLQMRRRREELKQSEWETGPEVFTVHVPPLDKGESIRPRS